MGICQATQEEKKDQQPKRTIVFQTKIDRTTVEFLNGSAFSVDSEGLIVPVIQKGKEIEIDYDVLSELKRTEYREEIENFVKQNLQAILEKSNHIFVSESKDIKANKIILVKFNADESYGPEAVANLNNRLREALEYLCSQNVLTISVPQLLKIGNVGIDQSLYCDEVSKATCEFSESIFNRLNRIIFASPNRKLVEDLAASFKKAAIGRAKNTVQSPGGTIAGESTLVPTEQKPVEPILKAAAIPKADVEADKKKEEAEKKKIEEEKEKKRLAEEADKKKDEEEKKLAQEADKKKEDEEKKRLEAEKKKQEEEEAEREQQRKEAEAAEKKLREEAEKKRKEEEEAVAKRIEAEAEAQRKEDEAVAEKLRLEAEAEKKRKEEAEEAERKRLEAEAETKRQEEEAEKKRIEEEAEAERKRQEEEETRKRKLSEEAKREKEEEQRKLEEEEAKNKTVEVPPIEEPTEPKEEIIEEKDISEGQSTAIGDEIKDHDHDHDHDHEDGEAGQDDHPHDGTEEGKKKKKKKGKKN